MSSAWLSKLANAFPFRAEVKVKKEKIERRVTIDVSKFNECEIKEVRRQRSFWREDKVDLVHKEPGKRIRYKPLK